MSWLIDVIVDLWCGIWRIQRDIDTNSKTGKSEMEVRNERMWMAFAFGATALAIVVCLFVFRT